MHVQRLADDVGDGHAGVEGGIGILKDHGGLGAKRLDVRLWSSSSCPSYEDFAAVGLYRCRMVRPTVVLPQPDSPTNPSVSPGWMAEGHVVDGLERLRPEHAHVDVKILFEMPTSTIKQLRFSCVGTRPSVPRPLSSASSMLPSSRPF